MCDCECYCDYLTCFILMYAFNIHRQNPSKNHKKSNNSNNTYGNIKATVDISKKSKQTHLECVYLPEIPARILNSIIVACFLMLFCEEIIIIAIIIACLPLTVADFCML